MVDIVKRTRGNWDRNAEFPPKSDIYVDVKMLPMPGGTQEIS